MLNPSEHVEVIAVVPTQQQPAAGGAGAGCVDEPRVPRWGKGIFRQRGVIEILVLTGCIVALLVVSEILSVINQIRALPLLLQIPACTIIGVVLLFGLYAIFRLAGLYLKLKASPVISVSALRLVHDRAKMRKEATNHAQSATESIRDFLTRYGKPEISTLEKVGLESEEVNRLNLARAALIKDFGQDDFANDPFQWIDRVDREFLQCLDIAGRRRIKRYSRNVAFRTAAVPNGFFDTLIVLINAYLMVGDLCVMYNVRAGMWGTFSILCHIFVNGFAAGHVDNITGALADHAADAITQHGTGIMANVAKGVSKVAARAADGYINGLLIRRLGRLTIRHLRPLVEQSKAEKLQKTRQPSQKVMAFMARSMRSFSLTRIVPGQ